MTPEEELDSFLDKYSPELAAEGRAILKHLRERLPGATRMVYDNYNALVIGFAAENRVSAVVLSIALYPKWINLFFMRGVELNDPHGLLKGEGGKIRHIARVTTRLVRDRAVDALIAQAMAISEPQIDPAAAGELVIKSISAKQRPRRPRS